MVYLGTLAEAQLVKCVVVSQLGGMPLQILKDLQVLRHIYGGVVSPAALQKLFSSALSSNSFRRMLWYFVAITISFVLFVH